MADWKKRKRVRTMRRVLREHGSPVPKRGCLSVVIFVAGLSLFITWASLASMGRLL